MVTTEQQHIDKEIYEHFMTGEMKKTAIAVLYNISPRTVGRAIERHKKTLVTEEVKEEAPQQEENVLSSTGFQCLVSPNSFIQIFKMKDGVVVDQKNILKSNPLFNDTFEHIMQSGMSDESLQTAFDIASMDSILEVYTQGRVKADPSTGRVTYTNDEGMERDIPSELNDRIINMVKEGEKGISSLVKFTEHLMENPSRNSVMELYKFMENNCIGIDEDGYIIAYKGVNDRLYDCYSNTFDNSPGQNPTVDRNMVDDDARNECSYGLHVGAKEYATGFGTRTVLVRLNPKDVVACTADYGFQKMRCCSYHVIKEI